MNQSYFSQKDVDILEKKPVFQGFFRMDKYRLQHALFDGGQSEIFQREIFERGSSACVLPWDPIRDEIILVEQFRVGALTHPISPWLLEVVAGMIEVDESPKEVVIRESKEEAGLDISRLKSIGSYLASPGGTTERVWLFIGEVDATKAGGVHGLKEEHEDIRVHVLDRKEICQNPFQSRFDNAASLLAIQWLQIHHEDLKSDWG